MGVRDIDKVFQGLNLCKPSTTPQAFARLWLHETTRVFEDRLIKGHDRTVFKTIMSKHFKEATG